MQDYLGFVPTAIIIFELVATIVVGAHYGMSLPSLPSLQDDAAERRLVMYLFFMFIALLLAWLLWLAHGPIHAAIAYGAMLMLGGCLLYDKKPPENL